VSLLKKFIKDTAIYGIAAVLPKIVNVLLVKLHTAKLGPELYSDNTQFYVYAVYFNVLLTYGMETAFFRFFTKLQDNNKVVQTAFTAILSTSIIFLSGFLLFADSISQFLAMPKSYYIILVSILILDTLVVVPYAYLRVTKRPVKFAFFRIFNITIYAILNIFFLWLMPVLIEKGQFNADIVAEYASHPKVIYIFIANLVASGLTFVLFLPIIKQFKLGIDKALLLKMLRYSWPIMLAGLAYATNENLDKLLLGRMIDKQTMGIYAGVYKVGVLMALYVTAFRLGAEPFFFSQHKEKDAKQQYAKILLWFTIFGAVFLVGIMTFLNIVVKLLIGRAVYLQALGIVPVILTAYLLFGVYNNLAIWYKLTEKTRYAMYLSVFGALITIVFNLIMIPKIGYMASAWATLAAYGSMTTASYFIGRRHYKVPYEIGKVIFYIVTSGALGYLMFNYFYENYLIKIILLIAYILMVYLIEQKELKKLLKR
jgi:O-antigen/teichoic acid export membrane protein